MRWTRRGLIAGFGLISLVSAAFATVMHVPLEYPTIQEGIYWAWHGDTVLVAPGTYTGPGNRDIDFNGKAIVVMSEGGPEVTIIDCQGSMQETHRGFYFHNEEDASSVLKGFTIRNGYAYGSWPETCGGAILCWSSSPTIADNVIAGCTAEIDGGGIACESFLVVSSPTIVGNTICGNAAKYGGGVYADDSAPTIERNTIVGNFADLVGGGICCLFGSSPAALNSIVWGNGAGTGPGPNIFVGSGSSIAVTYCDVEGGWLGEGNIDADPMFVLEEAQDFRLLWESPCIDAGHPDSLDPDGTRSDMGAHFFDQGDYLTLYLTPDLTQIAPGGELGVTYTVINRWAQAEPFWLLSEALLPGGDTLRVVGPNHYTLPADFTVQRHLIHQVPLAAPAGLYGYRSRIGIPPATLYDTDGFEFTVVEP